MISFQLTGFGLRLSGFGKKKGVQNPSCGVRVEPKPDGRSPTAGSVILALFSEKHSAYALAVAKR
jgi:hypothetical protein